MKLLVIVGIVRTLSAFLLCLLTIGCSTVSNVKPTTDVQASAKQDETNGAVLDIGSPQIKVVSMEFMKDVNRSRQEAVCTYPPQPKKKWWQFWK